jgi:uncharacterized coiled-coil protein SlyX
MILIFLALLTLGAIVKTEASEELTRLRQRMHESPGSFSWEDRMQLRGELIRKNMLSAENLPDGKVANDRIIQMRMRIQQTDQSKRIMKAVKIGVDVGIAGLTTAVSAGTAGAATPAAVATAKGLGLVMDQVWKMADAQIEADFQQAMRYHMSQMPRGHLKTREEAIASLRAQLGGDVLLSDLPADVRKRIDQDPSLFISYQRERNARVDAFLAQVGEDVLDLQGQDLVHDIQIADLNKRLNATSAFLTTFALHTHERLKNLEASQVEFEEALMGLNEIVGKQGKQLDKNTKDLEFVKSWMLGKMSAAELVAAAESGFVSFSKKDLEKIQFQARVESFHSNAMQTLDLANDFIKIAAHFDVDPELLANMSKAVHFAQSGINLATNLFTGNVFGAFKALSGFFGGRDIGAERHADVMKALKGIHETQLVILENQKILSQQIAQVQETLLTMQQEILDTLSEQFKRAHTNIASIQAIATHILERVELAGCKEILSRHIQILGDPRDALSDATLVTLFADSSIVRSTQNCRDNFYGLFFNTLNHSAPTDLSKPHDLFIHGVHVESRNVADVEGAWNKDQDFHAMIDLVQNLHSLNPKEWSLNQAFSALQRPTPDINAILLREQVIPHLNEFSQWSQFFKNRLQPEIVTRIAQKYRNLLPFLNRVSTNGFLALSDIDPANALFRQTRDNNLKVVHAMYQYLKIAEAQERLSGGSFLLPTIHRILLRPHDLLASSSHVDKDKIYKASSKLLAQALRRNPHLAQNYALYSMSEHFDARMGFNRSAFLAAGRIKIPAANRVLASQFKKAFEGGDVEALRNLLPSDWRVLCREDLDADLKQAWSTSFHLRLQCSPDHHKEFQYWVRLRGFKDLVASEKSPQYEVYFPLPSPAVLTNELLSLSPELLKLEDESAAFEEVMLNHQSMKNIGINALRTFDGSLLGGI